MLKVQVSSLLFAFLASISLATSAADAPPAKTPTVEVAQVVDADMQVSKVNLNTADAETLERELLGVGKVKAVSIVDHRAANGPFASVDDLLEVKGIGAAILEKNRDRLSVN